MVSQTIPSQLEESKTILSASMQLFECPAVCVIADWSIHMTGVIVSTKLCDIQQSWQVLSSGSLLSLVAADLWPERFEMIDDGLSKIET